MGGGTGGKGTTRIRKECGMEIGKEAKVEECRFLSVAFFGSTLLLFLRTWGETTAWRDGLSTKMHEHDLDTGER